MDLEDLKQLATRTAEGAGTIAAELAMLDEVADTPAAAEAGAPLPPPPDVPTFERDEIVQLSEPLSAAEIAAGQDWPVTTVLHYALDGSRWERAAAADTTPIAAGSHVTAR